MRSRHRIAAALVLALNSLLAVLASEALEKQNNSSVSRLSIELEGNPGLQAWLHIVPQRTSAKNSAVVILAPPLGFSAGTAMRRHADVLALSGLAVVTFDYPTSCLRGLTAVSCHRQALQQLGASLHRLTQQYSIRTDDVAIVGVGWSAGIALDVIARTPRSPVRIAVAQVSKLLRRSIHTCDLLRCTALLALADHNG